MCNFVEKNLRDNKTTSLTFCFCDIKKKAVECNSRASPPEKRYLYANVKNCFVVETMGGEEHCSWCLFIRKRFYFSIHLGFAQYLWKAWARMERRKWKEKSETVVCNFIPLPVLCHFSLWKQNSKDDRKIESSPTMQLYSSKQVAFPDVVKQINHFFQFHCNVFLLPLSTDDCFTISKWETLSMLSIIVNPIVIQSTHVELKAIPLWCERTMRWKQFYLLRKKMWCLLCRCICASTEDGNSFRCFI